jgi:hypothetical protein
MKLNFASWCFDEEVKELELLSEMFDNISSFQPKDGKWEKAPSNANGQYRYFFNAEGDEELCGGAPCYIAAIQYWTGRASISFKHRGTMYADREKGQNIGVAVMHSVLKALQEFLEVASPDRLTWAATVKTRTAEPGKSNNPQARKKVYFAWAVKSLFPHKFVPVGAEEWWSVEHYQRVNEHSPEFPPIPTKGGLRSAKEFAGEVMIAQKAKDTRGPNFDSQTGQRIGQQPQPVPPQPHSQSPSPLSLPGEDSFRDVRRAAARAAELRAASSAFQQRVRDRMSRTSLDPLSHRGREAT